jgi:hypothetical protein
MPQDTHYDFNLTTSLVSAFEVHLQWDVLQQRRNVVSSSSAGNACLLHNSSRNLQEILKRALPKIRDITESDPEAVHYFIVFRADVPGQSKPFVMTCHITTGPDLGHWNSNWENDFVESVMMVQTWSWLE